MTVYAQDFDIQKRDGQGNCPFDFLKLKFIDESGAPNKTFPLDAGAEPNGVKLCGTLLNTRRQVLPNRTRRSQNGG